jgi:hypothetical protein
VRGACGQIGDSAGAWFGKWGRAGGVGWEAKGVESRASTIHAPTEGDQRRVKPASESEDTCVHVHSTHSTQYIHSAIVYIHSPGPRIIVVRAPLLASCVRCDLRSAMSDQQSGRYCGPPARGRPTERVEISNGTSFDNLHLLWRICNTTQQDDTSTRHAAAGDATVARQQSTTTTMGRDGTDARLGREDETRDDVRQSFDRAAVSLALLFSSQQTAQSQRAHDGCGERICWLTRTPTHEKDGRTFSHQPPSCRPS